MCSHTSCREASVFGVVLVCALQLVLALADRHGVAMSARGVASFAQLTWPSSLSSIARFQVPPDSQCMALFYQLRRHTCVHVGRGKSAPVLRGGARQQPSSRALSSPAADDSRAAQLKSATNDVVRSPLFSLGPGLVEATVVRRPSERNKSPFVGDVQLKCGRIVIAHMPSLDMGGKCIAGAEVLLKVAVDRKGSPIGADATGKYGTPKCEFIMQLLRTNEPYSPHGGWWVGAHPKIGEMAANALLAAGVLDAALGMTIVKVQSEVSNPAGTDMRCDFLVTDSDARTTVIEVKTVVDCDYDLAVPPSQQSSSSSQPQPVLGDSKDRTAIFPWGKARQKGPDGEKVVSARAIKHVDELAALARGERTETGGVRLGAAVLFLVVRGDAVRFRPHAEACPSFAHHLREAKAAGVHVIARRITWGDNGEAFDDGAIPVDLGA